MCDAGTRDSPNINAVVSKGVGGHLRAALWGPEKPVVEEVMEVSRNEEAMEAELRVNCTRMYSFKPDTLIFLKVSAYLVSVLNGWWFPHHINVGVNIAVVYSQGIVAVCLCKQ